MNVIIQGKIKNVALVFFSALIFLASIFYLISKYVDVNDSIIPSVEASATGGTITYSGGYAIHTFTSTGTFTVLAPITAEVLVVAGGGGGGRDYGGGGGAGGLVYHSGKSVGVGSYTVTVGGGGAGGNGSSGYKGGNSVFSDITAIGGGGGGQHVSTGGNGGSGGGGGYSGSQLGGISEQTNSGGGLGYGNSGGRGGWPKGGGGGGSGGASTSQHGGVGRAYSISGVSVAYAGGGGGAATSGEPQGIGQAGGGNGGGYHATANSGSGGGGCGGVSCVAGNGGSGIVIIKYLLSYTVTYNGNGGSCTPGSRSVSNGGTSAAPSCNRTGYTLTGFTRTAGSGGTLNTSTGEVTGVTGDQTITANWSINSYTVSYNQNLGCCAPLSRTVNYSSTSAAPSCYRTGYSLSGFTRTAGSGGTLNTSTGEVTSVSGNQTIQAGWSYNTPTSSSCNPLPGDSTHTITSNCSFPFLLDGVDAGTGSTNSGVLNVSSGVLTINSTQTIVAGTINLTGGSIAMVSGAQIKMNTPIYALDVDGDAWGGGWIFNTTGGAGYIRRNTLQSLSIADCNDSANEGANLCCVN